MTPAFFFANRSELLKKTNNQKGTQMGSTDELILRATKEIIVKFIETGRLGPTGFHETFKSVYKTVEEIAKGSEQISEQDTEAIDS